MKEKQGVILGSAYYRELLPKVKRLRGFVDQLEMRVDDSLWTLPKYRQLLFSI